MRLIKNNLINHVSSDTIAEFEEIILHDLSVSIAKTPKQAIIKIQFFIYRLLRKLFHFTSFKTESKYAVKPIADKNHLFLIMMGLNKYLFREHLFFTKHNRSVYLFDAWTSDHEEIIDFANEFKIDFLFVTASQAVEALSPKLLNSKIFWIPEGINPTKYKQDIHFNDKQIDILALGRRYDLYHNMIVEDLEAKEVNYLYEKIKGEIIFPSREDFIEGLSKTKISICVPSNITHPERAGDVETMTIRYLQSIVSKCIIVGHAPVEMIELFGYNPVIEINMEKPVEQLIEILDDFENYIPVIEQNYKTVITNHTWSNRWEQMKNIWNKQV